MEQQKNTTVVFLAIGFSGNVCPCAFFFKKTIVRRYEVVDRIQKAR